jgi:DNA-binding MarR family transcriptional regulator
MRKHVTEDKYIVTSNTPISVNVSDAGGDGHWFRMFSAIVQGGTWSSLSGSAAKIVVVLAESVNDATRRERGEWLAWPSITTIMERAGLKRAIVYRSISELEKAGVLKRRTSGKGTTTTMYQLLEPGVYSGRPVHTSRPVGSTGARAGGLPPYTQLRLNDLDRSSSRSSSSKPTKPAPSTAAGSAAAGEVMEALTLAEISEPTRSKLASLDGITAELVERVTRSARDRGKGTGAIVNDIKAAIEKKATTPRRRRVERVTTSTAAADREATAAEQQRIDQVIAGLSDDELRQHAAAALAGLDVFTRRRLESADPRTSATLRAGIYQLVTQALQRK